MEQNLISKKELLDLTGISYGQLYRWKRKSLIPEEWFIKKSSYTGQETFFPKEKIIDRIGKIMNMKGDLSLNDIADAVSPMPVSLTLTRDELKERGIVTDITLNLYLELYPDTVQFTFEKLLNLYIANKLFESGAISTEEGRLLLEVMENNYSNTGGRGGNVYVIRKSGVTICILEAGEKEIFFDQTAKIAAVENISGCTEELKNKI